MSAHHQALLAESQVQGGRGVGGGQPQQLAAREALLPHRHAPAAARRRAHQELRRAAGTHARLVTLLAEACRN